MVVLVVVHITEPATTCPIHACTCVVHPHLSFQRWAEVINIKFYNSIFPKMTL